MVSIQNLDDFCMKSAAQQAQMTTKSGTGWEDDESLEEIDDLPIQNQSPVEQHQQNTAMLEEPVESSSKQEDIDGQEEDDQLNRSISANEQVSDVVQTSLI